MCSTWLSLAWTSGYPGQMMCSWRLIPGPGQKEQCSLGYVLIRAGYCCSKGHVLLSKHVSNLLWSGSQTSYLLAKASYVAKHEVKSGKIFFIHYDKDVDGELYYSGTKIWANNSIYHSPFSSRPCLGSSLSIGQ